MSFAAQKRDVLRLLLPLCPYVGIDTSHAGVDVPPELRAATGQHLVLRVGETPAVMAMPDLVIDDAGWSATLSVRGRRVHVTIPWHACFAFWVDEPFAGPQVAWPPEAAPEKPARPHLRAV